jgi:hypothetical protein
MEQTRSELRAGLALQLAAAVEQGAAPDESALGQAAAAGVFPQEWLADYRRTPQPLAVADTCDWLRRIDERAAGDDDHLVVQIALSPIPVEERRLLLRRVQATAALPPEQRAETSGIFYGLALEQGFAEQVRTDYRFRCMKPVTGWRRRFLSRYLNTELWRVLGVPVWEVEYRDGVVFQQRFMLLRFIGWKIGIKC